VEEEKQRKKKKKKKKNPSQQFCLSFSPLISCVLFFSHACVSAVAHKYANDKRKTPSTNQQDEKTRKEKIVFFSLKK
jgi:hypothetical protein